MSETYGPDYLMEGEHGQDYLTIVSIRLPTALVQMAREVREVADVSFDYIIAAALVAYFGSVLQGGDPQIGRAGAGTEGAGTTLEE